MIDDEYWRDIWKKEAEAVAQRIADELRAIQQEAQRKLRVLTESARRRGK